MVIFSLNDYRELVTYGNLVNSSLSRMTVGSRQARTDKRQVRTKRMKKILCDKYPRLIFALTQITRSNLQFCVFSLKTGLLRHAEKADSFSPFHCNLDFGSLRTFGVSSQMKTWWWCSERLGWTSEIRSGLSFLMGNLGLNLSGAL